VELVNNEDTVVFFLWLMYEEVSSYAVVNQSPVSLAAPSNQSPMSPKKSAFTLSVNTNKKDNQWVL
jgi:hypothetical protein